MAVISSTTLKESRRMTERIAEEDIIEVNELGQSVVVVPKGQPIPEGVVVPAEKKAKQSAPENKARARAATKKK